MELKQLSHESIPKEYGSSVLLFSLAHSKTPLIPPPCPCPKFDLLTKK